MFERDGALLTWSLAALPAPWRRSLGLPPPCVANPGSGTESVSTPDERGPLRRDPQVGPRPIGGANAEGGVTAIRLPDHRIAYLDYEGPLSGDRGSVTRCDGGDVRLTAEPSGVIHARLAGGRIHGDLCLKLAEHPTWMLSFTPRCREPLGD